VEYDSMEEALAEAVSQPGEVSSGVAVGGGIGLHLESEEVLPGELGEDVDLVAPVLLAQVVEAGSRLAARAFGAELGGDEGVEKPPEQVAIA
jgi:hypothetical protein